MILAATTQPVWTPEAVESLIRSIAYILVPAFALVLVPAVIALINAAKAKGQSTATQQQVNGMQSQLTTVAMNQTPPAPPPVTDHERLSAINPPPAAPWIPAREVNPDKGGS